ncbi:hypothetical protein PVAG01_01085 [Phlyctema vagabunda]|uniref:RING-type domain-containing protein n=1 Tax=Phlyctema vagabunda TaxID=108571 RepID=A0ABR4PW56_9HELO
MATSTVARSLVACLSVVSALAGMAAGQSISPTNATLSRDTRNSLSALEVPTGDQGNRNFTLAPLTANVALGGSPKEVAAVSGYSGSLLVVGPSNTGNVTRSDIAYINCDPNSDTSNIDPIAVAEAASLSEPRAIIFYSLTSSYCNLTGTLISTYATLYSMTTVEESQTLEGIALSSRPVSTVVGGNGSSSDDSNTGNSNSINNGSPAPTTAVAMSILYSITGIITLLFLIIIATGAIRAHRHPERYGPRNGFPGRPRQSRAKGLARAMLETLPIVKFGDPEPEKPGNRDIEMDDGNSTARHSTTTPPTGADVAGIAADKSPPASSAGTAESGLGPAAHAESTHSNDHAPAEGDLGCSICTEDFTTGEDVRVLPCNHKYHPACIDPWLLNVSGTCPLCRHDLRPEASNNEVAAEGDELPPPLNPAEGASENEAHPRRGTRFLDLHRLRHAPAHERIAALRSLREQSRRDGNVVEQTAPEATSGRTRLTGRLREAFRIRTRAEPAQ